MIMTLIKITTMKIAIIIAKITLIAISNNKKLINIYA